MKNMIGWLQNYPLTQSKRAQYHLKGGPDTLRASDIQSLAERLVKEKSNIINPDSRFLSEDDVSDFSWTRSLKRIFLPSLKKKKIIDLNQI